MFFALHLLDDDDEDNNDDDESRRRANEKTKQKNKETAFEKPSFSLLFFFLQ